MEIKQTDSTLHISPVHTFVVLGSLPNIRADAFLVGSGEAGNILPAWASLFHQDSAQSPTQLSDDLGKAYNTDGVVSIMAGREATGRNHDYPIIITKIVPSPIEYLKHADADVELNTAIASLKAGLRRGLSAAETLFRNCPEETFQHRRVPLVAMPLVGTGAGGFAHARGAAITAMLEVITDFQSNRMSQAFDIVIVCKDAADYAALQRARRNAATRPPSWMETLIRAAASGQLGVLFGAGASATLGLPMWDQLLELLCTGLDTIDAKSLERLDPIDAASLILSELGEGEAGNARFLERLATHVHTTETSLTHSLLANLKPRIAMTTNYDGGYEIAVAGMKSETTGGRACAVLPWEQPKTSTQPVLLKLHGDVELGSVVLAREHFISMQAHKRPLGAVLQERMLVGHLLAVGTSMSDSTLVQAAEEVASLMHHIPGASSGKQGTVLLTTDSQARRLLLERSFNVIAAGPSGGDSREFGRDVEIMLDTVAMFSSRSLGYLLDSKYDDLLPTDEGTRELIDTLRAALSLCVDRQLSIEGQELAEAVSAALSEF